MSLLLAADVFSQMRAYVLVDFEGPVEYTVTDSQGKRSGYDPITNTDYNEIPYAGYGLASDGETREFGFHSILKDTLFSTTYTIQAFGTGSAVFVGDALARQTWSGKGGQFHTEGVIDKNQTLEYKFSYSTDSTIVPTFTKVVTLQIIRQDFENCFKLKLFGKEEFYKDLVHQLDDIVKDVAHKDSVEARKDLEKFSDEFEDVFNETFKDNPKKNAIVMAEFEKTHKKFVGLDAYKILSEDVSLLLQQLPKGHEKGHER